MIKDLSTLGKMDRRKPCHWRWFDSWLCNCFKTSNPWDYRKSPWWRINPKKSQKETTRRGGGSQTQGQWRGQKGHFWRNLRGFWNWWVAIVFFKVHFSFKDHKKFYLKPKIRSASILAIIVSKYLRHRNMPDRNWASSCFVWNETQLIM